MVKDVRVELRLTSDMAALMDLLGTSAGADRTGILTAAIIAEARRFIDEAKAGGVFTDADEAEAQRTYFRRVREERAVVAVSDGGVKRPRGTWMVGDCTPAVLRACVLTILQRYAGQASAANE